MRFRPRRTNYTEHALELEAQEREARAFERISYAASESLVSLHIEKDESDSSSESKITCDDKLDEVSVSNFNDLWMCVCVQIICVWNTF